MKKIIIFIVCYLIGTIVYAQTPADSVPLDYNGLRETVYLQTSKGIYETGEDLWFKAYAFDAQTLALSDRSRTLFVEMADGRVAQAACPEWMKLFAWGTYGMGGLEEFHDWMHRAGAERGEQLDPREDFDFLAQMGGMFFDNWLELEEMDDSDGIAAANGVHWKAKYAEDRGIPYAYRLYMPCNGYNWVNRRFADHMEQPAPWMLNGWLRYETSHQPHISWYDADIWGYMARQTRDLMKAFKTPAVRGWMHPAGRYALTRRHPVLLQIHGSLSRYLSLIRI